MKKVRKNQQAPDLRYMKVDEEVHVNGGVLYLKNCVVQVWWDSGPETWWLPSSKENRQIAKEFFQAKKEELTF